MRGGACVGKRADGGCRARAGSWYQALCCKSALLSALRTETDTFWGRDRGRDADIDAHIHWRGRGGVTAVAVRK